MTNGERSVKTLERLLREERRRSEAVMSLLSHELRTPLSIIKGYLDLAVDGVLGPLPEPLREPLLRSRESAERLHRLIENILDLSKIEKGPLLRLESVSLHILLSRAAAPFEPKFKKKDQRFSLRVEENLPLILADPEKLSEAISHLLDNANRFGPEKAGIEMSAALSDVSVKGSTREAVEVRVWNSGSAIPRAHQKRIFLPFEQLENPLRRRGGGAGIGLAHTRAITEAHGGSIRLGAPERGGVEFAVLLPVDSLSAEPRTDKGKATRRPPGGARAKISR